MGQTVLEVTGKRGKFVGLISDVDAPGVSGHGDHFIWVDEVRSPALRGTGLEDDVGYSWSFERGTDSLHAQHPFAGKIGVSSKASALSYRFFIADAINFENYFRYDVTIEENDLPTSGQCMTHATKMASTAFYYAFTSENVNHGSIGVGKCHKSPSKELLVQTSHACQWNWSTILQPSSLGQNIGNQLECALVLGSGCEYILPFKTNRVKTCTHEHALRHLRLSRVFDAGILNAPLSNVKLTRPQAAQVLLNNENLGLWVSNVGYNPTERISADHFSFTVAREADFHIRLKVVDGSAFASISYDLIELC